jgi:hypothetical protein
MPHVVCPRCQRANPNEAVYCHFDGFVLRQGPAAPQPVSQMNLEFVFPSGRRCRNFDDLLQGCHAEWAEARDLLRKGAFARFLSSIGRQDLARAAQETQAQSDADIALHNFVSCLPVHQVQGPRLDLSPRRINLGALRAGETRQVRLTVMNQGNGLLQGKLSVSEGGEWLRLAEADGKGQCALKTAREQQIMLQVDTHGLAAPCAYSAKLTVITNGGIAEVPIRMDVGSHPFPRPPFVGVGSPREMAERMRTQPKPAVALLENGDVQRWFALNGWTYPVEGPPAKGVAAVQQFFEGMGLSKPPPLALSESDVRICCVPPEVVRGQISLRTPVKKWVYAQIDSDAPWLRVVSPTISGAQQAAIEFEVDASLVDPGIHDGRLLIVANAGQKLSVRVRLEVTPPHEPFTRKLLKPFFLGMLLGLLYRLLLIGPADLFARLFAPAVDPSIARGSLESWKESPIFMVVNGQLEMRLEFVKYFVVATWWVGALGGAVLLWQRGSRWADVLCGSIAGAVAGLAGAASLACFLELADGLPRLLLRHLSGVLKPANGSGAAWLWTPLWLALAVLCWTAVGGAAGFLLRCAGKPGRLALEWTAWPVAWVLQTCGLKGLAGFFVE